MRTSGAVRMWGSGPAERVGDGWWEVVLLTVLADEGVAVVDDDLGAHVVGEWEVGGDGESHRQVGIKLLELAQQIADGQVTGQEGLQGAYGAAENGSGGG